MIEIFNTHINKDAFSLVQKTLETTFISEGKLVKEFELKLSEGLGFVNPIALNSGTSALHLALVLAGIKEGDEVICPAQTFIASALVIKQEKAVPVFADIQYENGNIDPGSVEALITPRTKAIMAVHWGGYPCDMDELIAISKKYNLVLIEDAAHAPGAEYKGAKIGSLSDFTCFSFQAIKHITTGDGGALCMKDKGVFAEGIKRRWFGIDRSNTVLGSLGEREYDVDKVGFKYHMNDYSAALGLANLLDFETRLEKRRAVANKYKKLLANVSGLSLFKETVDRKSAYWLFGMHVESRENFVKALNASGIRASVVHRGIDKNSIFGGTNELLANQRKFDSTQIHIPIHDGITEEMAEYICECINKGW